MFASKTETITDVTPSHSLFTFMKESNMARGDLVCFEGDEDELLLGIGLVVDIKGNVDDVADFESAIKEFYDEDEYWRMSHILPTAPMICVLWTRSVSHGDGDFNLYNMEKMGYSFMWVYPTEIRVITADILKKKGK